MTKVVGRAYEQDQYHPAPGDVFGRLNNYLPPAIQLALVQRLNPRAFHDAAAVERYYLLADAWGVSREEADRLLAAARSECAAWEWWFDPLADAERRLRERYVCQWPEPPVEVRRTAREMLVRLGSRYTPADVDDLARGFTHLGELFAAETPEQRAQRLRLRQIHAAYSRRRSRRRWAR